MNYIQFEKNYGRMTEQLKILARLQEQGCTQTFTMMVPAAKLHFYRLCGTSMYSNSCCLLNQNTAYVVTANHNCHHFLFISMGVNCYTFTCYNYVQLTKGLRQLRKCKKRINQYGHCCRCHHKPRSHTQALYLCSQREKFV